MKNSFYILIASVASLLALMAIYFFFRKSCKKSGRCLLPAGEIDCLKMLSLGDSGPEVCLLQEWINGLSPNCVPVNGRFDERTEAALFDIIGAPSASLQEISHPDNPC